MSVDFNFMVGGEAGQGVQSVGFLLAKVFARNGYSIFADQDYESRIRGGHNFFRVRVKDSRVSAIAEPVNILVALNKESIDLHHKELTVDGIAIFDVDKIKDISAEDKILGIPLERLAEEKAGNKVMTNTVALGAALALVDCDLVMVHAEDEIAAVNMAIGAAYAGTRAMTATSGSGFCLMVEGIGLAGITETPIVVIDGQRPGPAVGLPTRTEQGNLQFVLHAHHGEFPRAVLAPATIEDAFWLTVKAFNLAEKYQLPVIILTDHHLASSYATVDPFDISEVKVDRGLLFPEKEDDPSEYKRHKITQSGISPRAFPGMSKALVVTDCDEHDEAGHLIEDAETRMAQVEKRMRKLFSLKQEISLPSLYGSKKANTTLIGWGSTYGAIHEAVDMLRHDGASVNMLHLNELWPFPTEAVTDAVSKANNSYVIENNATGQLARLIKAETGCDVSGKILKFDGRPFTPAYIAEAMRKEGC
ncbi:MAG: 2-oxoacid:acceptor oxidoreductase subunit alpha [Chloroflexota bacterium]